MNLYQPTITGSLSVSGSINLSGSITIAGGGTISGTASIATNAITASSADNFLVRNTLTAQTLVVQTITSSVDFVTGSTRFGSISGNTHQFTGSVGINGTLSGASATFNGSIDTYGGFNMVGSTSYLTINRANTASDGVIIFRDATVNKWILGARGENTNNFYLYSYGTSGHPLVINYSTGAATFSSSVTADYLTSNGGGQINTTVSPLVLFNSSGGGNARRMGFSMTNLDSAKIYSLNDNGTTRVDNILVANVLNGNVGIGTSSPQYQMTVLNTINIGMQSYTIDNNGSRGGLRLYSNNSTGSPFIKIGAAYSSISGAALWWRNWVSSPNNGSLIWESGEGSVLDGSNNEPSSWSERMRITSSGRVYIGASSGGEKFVVYNDINSASSVKFQTNCSTGESYGPIILAGTNSSDAAFRVFNQAGTSYLTIRGDGYISSVPTYNNTYGNAANMYIGADGFMGRSTSSLKYKENVLDYSKGLVELMQLRPVSYTSKNPQEEGQTFAGLIAEEVHDLGLTEFVQYAEDGTPDALAYQNMIALLIKGMQEQQAQIEELKALIAAK